MNESVKKIQEMLSSTTAALIFSQANRFYLSGFETDAGVILITKNDAVFFTDFRYPADDNVRYTERYLATLRAQGFLNNDQ